MGDIYGILPALVTPFDADGRVNTAVLRQLVQFQLAGGVHGFFINGGTGEGLLLDPAERKLTLETILDEVNGRVPVIAHVGAIATHVATDLAAHAASAGATAVAAIPPIYFRVDMDGMLEHYRRIAQAAVGIPVWLYHIPGATGVTITPVMYAELLKIDGVGGLKYTSYNFFHMQQIVEISRTHNYPVLSGPDEMCLPALIMGAHGAIGTTYNVLPGHFVTLYEQFRAGNWEAAQALQFQANQVIEALVSVSSLAALKQILSWMGFDCGVPRRPLRPLTDDEKRQLWRALEQTCFSEVVGVPLKHAA